MTKVTQVKGTERTTKKEIINVDYSNLVIKYDDNYRDEYGDVNELSFQIESNGQLEAIRGYKEKDESGNETGKFIVTHGFRRCKAIGLIIERTGKTFMVKLELEPKYINREQIIINHWLLNNSGKSFTQIEQARMFQELLNFGWSEGDISKKLGKSMTFVKNMLLVINAPKKVVEKVKNKEISATAAAKVLQRESDPETAIEIMDDAIETAQKKAKTKKEKSKKSKKDSSENIIEEKPEPVTATFSDTIYHDDEKQFSLKKITEISTALNDSILTNEALLIQQVEQVLRGNISLDEFIKERLENPLV